MNRPHPKKVQRCVLFYILYFFCQRDCENLYLMENDWFETKVDPDGTKYVAQVKDEMDKSHRSDDTTETNQARMYENPGMYSNSVTNLITALLNKTIKPVYYTILINFSFCFIYFQTCSFVQ